MHFVSLVSAGTAFMADEYSMQEMPGQAIPEMAAQFNPVY
jgi:hypothetical protein